MYKKFYENKTHMTKFVTKKLENEKGTSFGGNIGKNIGDKVLEIKSKGKLENIYKS